MSLALTINPRGTVTIPRALREALGVPKGGLVRAVLEDGKVVLEPAFLAPCRVYSDAEIASLKEEDALSPAESRRLRAVLKGKKATVPARA